MLSGWLENSFFFFFLSLFSVILGNWLDKFGGPPIQIYFIDFTK